MTAAKAIDNLTKNPLLLAGGIGLLVVAVYFLARKTVTDAANAAGGIVTGRNAITQAARTDAFEGKGLPGTVGAAVDLASGGFLSRAGENIGETIFGWFNPDVEALATEVHYAVTFSDGSRHAISSLDVDKNGYFTRGGIRYRIGFNNAGLRVAVRQ